MIPSAIKGKKNKSKGETFRLRSSLYEGVMDPKKPYTRNTRKIKAQPRCIFIRKFFKVYSFSLRDMTLLYYFHL